MDQKSTVITNPLTISAIFCRASKVKLIYKNYKLLYIKSY